VRFQKPQEQEIVTAWLCAVSNNSIRNINLAMVLFPDKCGAVPCEVEKVPWSRQFSKVFGTKRRLQTGQYQAAHSAYISLRLDNSQSMGFFELRNRLVEVEGV
jgi:hypothetical protein